MYRDIADLELAKRVLAIVLDYCTRPLETERDELLAKAQIEATTWAIDAGVVFA